MTIGERIKLLRESKNVTQTELAKIAGTSKQNIYKYENGIITNIPSNKVEIIAKYFHVSPAYLMGWEEEKWRTDPELNNGYPIPPGPHYAKMKDKQLSLNIKQQQAQESVRLIPILDIDDVTRTVLDLTFGADYNYAPLICNDIQAQSNLIYVRNNSKYNDFKNYMCPLIEDDDIILLDFGANAENGDLTLVEFCPGKNFPCRYFKYNDFMEFQFQSQKSKRIYNEDPNLHRYTVRGVVKQIIKNISY